MDEPIPTLYVASPVLTNPVFTISSQIPVIPVKPWISAAFSPTTYGHPTWISGDRLVSSYVTLTRVGNGISYPGGMAAGMGGGDAMGGGGGGSGGGGGEYVADDS